MAKTKIINVLKNDSFDDVFDAFQNTEAEEVIFIFPKGSKISKKEIYFETIRKAAAVENKKISIMSSDPLVTKIAAVYSIPIISKEDTAAKNRRINNNQKTKAKLVIVKKDEEEDEIAQEPYKKIPDVFDQEKTEEDENDDEEKENEEEQKETDTDKMFVNVKQKSNSSIDNQIYKMWSNHREDGTTPEIASKQNKTKSTSFFKKIGFVFTAAAIGVFCLTAYFTLGKATITIIPKKQPLNLELKVTASANINTVMVQNNKIPAQIFNKDEEISESFPASGNTTTAQKAHGIIMIYNKSTSSQKLVATTRFESKDGLIFRIAKSIEVPGGTKKNDVIIPGSIQAEIFADRPGSDYNIQASKFTIPGFKDSDKYEQFYGESLVAMTGGSLGPSKAVTQDDYDKALDTISQKIKTSLTAALANQTGELSLIQQPIVNLNEPTSNAKAGDAAENLNITVHGSAKTIAIKESDIKELVRSQVNKDSGVELVDKDLSISYKNQIISDDGVTVTFTARATGFVASKIDKNALLSELVGMKSKDIQSYFKNIKEIESTNINFSPFWVRDIPKNPKKITLEVKI